MMLATFRDWALDESPTSRRQAAWGDRYRIWLGLKGNALGMIGLSILQPRTWPTGWPNRARLTGSAPTSSAATSIRACSMAAA